MFFVYITTNLVNNKKYLGFSSMKKKNWETYLGSGKALKRAVLKYGESNFKREILQYFEKRDDAIAEERRLILENNCHLSDEWYNIATGFTTQGFKGKTHSPETIEKMKQAHTGIVKSNDSKAKQSATRLQRINDGEITFYNHTPQQLESVKKLGLANRGRKHKKTLCSHCGGEYGPAPYSRFHGDNCKFKSAV